MRFLLNALDIEKGEELKVFLLLIQSFFLGIYMSTYDVAATTLFMQEFGKDEVAQAFVLSGGLGVVLSYLFTKLQTRISFNALSIINLFIVALMVTSMRVMFEYDPGPWLYFLIFITFGPLNVLAMLGFWGVAGRIFSIRQGKRLFGLIDLGLIIGIILTGFMMPVILSVFHVSIINLLIISSVRTIVTAFLQVIININFKNEIDKETEASDSEKSNSVGFSEFFTNKYIKLLLIFMVLTTVSAFLLFFVFLGVLEEAYPAEKDFANFIGLYTSTMMIFIAIIKVFIYSKFVKTYGLKVALLILPIISISMISIAAFIGSFFGYTVESASFTLFFLVIALSRLIGKAIKDGIELPTLRLLYQPLDASIRYDVQAKIDGVVNEFSGALTGAIIIGLYTISGFEFIHINYIFVVIAILWIIAVKKLYDEYQNSLKESLTRSNDENSDGNQENVDTKLLFQLGVLFENAPSDKLGDILGFFKRFSPSFFSELMDLNYQSLKEYFNNIIAADLDEHNLSIIGFSKIKEQLIDSESDTIKKSIELLEVLKITDLQPLIKSRDKEKRLECISILIKDYKADYKHILIDLLKDPHQSVRLSAIQLGLSIPDEQLWGLVIENLDNDSYSSATAVALIEKGEVIIPILDNYFYKSGFKLQTLRKIVKVIGDIGGSLAVDSLISKINYPDFIITKQALICLSQIEGSVDEDQFMKYAPLIDDCISNIMWDMAAIEELKSFAPVLQMSIQVQINEHFDVLYNTLGLVYDNKTIANIRKNIESGTVESTGYAIELLDLFISEDLKPKLYPLLEDSSNETKVEQLRDLFPRSEYKVEELLSEILNRDINYTSSWTKYQTLQSILELKSLTISDTLIAQIFNEDLVLSETAAIVVYEISADSYHSISDRLNKEVKVAFDNILLARKRRVISQLERIEFLEKTFSDSGFDGNTLIDLNRVTEKKEYRKSQIVIKTKSKWIDDLYLVFDGKYNLSYDDEVIKEVEGVFGCQAIPRDVGEIKIECIEPGVILKIGREQLFNLMFDRPELIESILLKITELESIKEIN